jgi:hypothetical protein
MAWNFTLTLAASRLLRRGNAVQYTRAYASETAVQGEYARAKLTSFSGTSMAVRPAQTVDGMTVIPLVMGAGKNAFMLRSIGLYAQIGSAEVLFAVGSNADGVPIPSVATYPSFAHQINLRVRAGVHNREKITRQISYSAEDWETWSQGGGVYKVPRGVTTIYAHSLHNLRTGTIYLPNSIRSISNGATYGYTGVVNCEFASGVVPNMATAFPVASAINYNVPYPDDE